MFTPLHDLTIEQLERAADKYCEKWDAVNQYAARIAFIDAVLWAQKVNDNKIAL